MAWMCVCAVLLAAYVFPTFAPTLEHDSFQYLSVAENALQGRLGYTSTLHFDAERSFGAIPAPLVTFPMGYPLGIALLSLTGISFPAAGALLSAVATIACVPLLMWITARFGLSRLLRSVVVACFVFNGVVIQFGTTVMTDALFSFMVLGGVALLCAARLPEGGVSGSRSLWIASGLAFGAAYFVRYSGLFFVIALALLVAWHVVASNRTLAAGYATALAAAACSVMVGVVRNMWLIGNWRGRDEMAVNATIPWVIGRTGQGANVVFLGPGTGTPGGALLPKALLALILLAGLAWLIVGYVRRRSLVQSASAPTRGAGADLCVLAMTYLGCMAYAGLTSSISYGIPRNFLPVIPLLLLLFGLLLHSLLAAQPVLTRSGRILPAALLAGVCLYSYLNLMVFRLPRVDHVADVSREMDIPGPGGVSARDAIQKIVLPGKVIIANNGQAVGYALARPTMSLVGPNYSSHEWNENAIREAMRRFNAQAIVIEAPKGEVTGDGDQIPSEFVRRLAKGEAPAWMKLVHKSGDIFVYVPVPSLP